MLLQGEYQQVGFDLVITHPGGEQLVIADYFSQHPPPNLMLSSGIGLSPEMVRELLHKPFTDLMFAGPATESTAEVQIGTVKFVLGRVTATNADGERILGRGDPLYKGDEIRTDGRGFIRAEMLDGTKFNLGKNARATLSDFEFNEADQVGLFEATVFVGGFHYKSGRIGTLNPSAQHSTIKTPSAIIGIRGSELEGSVAEPEVEPEAEPEAEGDAEDQAEVEAQVDAEMQAEAETQVDVDAQAQVEAEVQAQQEAEPQEDAQNQADVESQAQTDAVQMEVQAEAEVQADLQAQQAETEVSAQLEGDTAVDPGAGVGSGVDDGAGAEVSAEGSVVVPTEEGAGEFAAFEVAGAEAGTGDAADVGPADGAPGSDEPAVGPDVIQDQFTGTDIADADSPFGNAGDRSLISSGTTATDPFGAVATSEFSLNVLGSSADAKGNIPPVLAAPIFNQTAIINQPFNFIVPSQTFNDADGEALSYNVNGLPPNLFFNAADNSINGIPNMEDEGLHTLIVTAFDASGGTAYDEFVLDVIEDPGEFALDNAAPVLRVPIFDQIAVENKALPIWKP